MSDYTFGGKYRLEEELAIGGCGTVYTGTHNVAGKQVAIKVEAAVETKHRSPLEQEARVYKTLAGGPGVPWAVWSGRAGAYNVLVLDRLGLSLEDLFKMCNRHFSLKTVLMLADQLLSRIEFIHSRDFVHRDIKPANFVMGTARGAGKQFVHVIDFGLAKKYVDPRTGAHIPYRQSDAHGVGTSLFAAIATHEGVEASRGDDLESLAYMLIYFLRGTLPWRRTRGTSIASTWSLIHAKKLAATAPVALPTSSHHHTHSHSHGHPPEPHHTHEQPHTHASEPHAHTHAHGHRYQHSTTHTISLTAGLPAEFAAFYAYSRALAFGDAPDYAGCRALFRGLAVREGIEYDGVFDWMEGGARNREREEKGRRCTACEGPAVGGRAPWR